MNKKQPSVRRITLKGVSERMEQLERGAPPVVEKIGFWKRIFGRSE
jgi:hypothetical protein